jgi:hypothetical protein
VKRGKQEVASTRLIPRVQRAAREGAACKGKGGKQTKRRGKVNCIKRELTGSGKEARVIDKQRERARARRREGRRRERRGSKGGE